MDNESNEFGKNLTSVYFKLRNMIHKYHINGTFLLATVAMHTHRQCLLNA